MISSIHRTLFRCLIGFPALALPFFLGGVRHWHWTWIAGLFFILTAFFIWIDRSDVSGPKPSLGKLLIAAVLVSYPFFQAVPLPLSWLARLSPRRLDWIEGARAAAGTAPPPSTLSYIPHETFFQGLWWLFLAVYAFYFFRFVQDGRNVHWLFRLLFLAAVLQACYGLLQLLVPSVGVLFEPGTFSDSNGSGIALARGSFVNRNHFAAFMGLLWPVLLARVLCMGKDLPESRKDVSFHQRQRARELRQKQVFFAFLVGLVILALIFSMSRGGILASLIALTLFTLLAGLRERKLMAIVLASWLVMFSYGTLIGFDEILSRFDRIAADAPGRFLYWKDTARIGADHLVTGTGLGTFEAAFKLYQTRLSDTRYAPHAHNDYVELFSELGAPFTILLVFCAWGFWWINALRLIRSGKSMAKEQRWIQAGALAGTAAFMLHCWVEFNWHVPANQLYFVMMLVLSGGVFSIASADDEKRRKTRGENHLAKTSQVRQPRA